MMRPLSPSGSGPAPASEACAARPGFLPPLFAAMLVGLALGSGCVHGGTGPAARLPAAQAASLLPEELEVATLINEFRAHRGLPALVIDPTLCRAARLHSENMAREGRMTHVIDGRGPADRAASAGFQGRVGENCACGSGTEPRVLVDLWLGSAAHRANLLYFQEGALGVGFASSPAGAERYLAALFGSLP